jgi:hypothetical protein
MPMPSSTGHRVAAGKRRVNQPGQQQYKQVVHAVTKHHTQPLANKPTMRKLKGIAHGNGALAQAQHAQHGAIVQVAGRKGACRQCHRHRA